MEYKQIKKMRYVKNTNIKELVNNIINSQYSYKLGIDIKGNPSFFIYTNEIAMLTENIYKNIYEIEKHKNILENIQGSFGYYLRECLIEELISTNDIEKIRSTRQEIEEALDSKIKKKVKFQYLYKKYKYITKKEEISLKTNEDVRNLYNEILFLDMEKDNIPDGIYYRKSSVYISDELSGKIHEGVLPEEQINNDMISLLNIINGDLPLFIKIALVQYFIGYIHPFYDGNGRLSRFICSYMLAKNDYSFLAYRLSYGIIKNKSKFYKSFEICNDKSNCGDITPFIINFLEIILFVTKDVNENLSDYISSFSFYYMKIIERFNKNEEDIFIHCFVSMSLFAIEGLTIEDISKQLEVSSQTVRKNIKKAEENGIPIIKGKIGKKNVYKIDFEKINEIISEEES